MKAFIPRDFDIDNHIITYPPQNFSIDNFDVSELKYLLSQIVLVPTMNRKLRDSMEDDFVPLSSKLLQSHIHDYAKYFNYLERTGVVSIKKYYRKKTVFANGECKGYKFSDKYFNNGIIRIEYEPKYLEKLIIRNRNDKQKKYIEFKKNYGHILKWLYPNANCKLGVNYEKALEFIELEKRALVAKPELQALKNTGKDKIYKTGRKKDPIFQFEISKINLDKIKTKDLDFVIDSTVYRLHHVLTNMKSILRNFVTYGSDGLVSIDLKNSQPYLSTILFNKKFWRSTPNTQQNRYITTYNNI